MTNAASSINRMIQSSAARYFQCCSTLSDKEFYADNDFGLSVAWITGHLVNSQDYFVSRMLDAPRKFEQYEKSFRGGRALTDDDNIRGVSRINLMADFRNCHQYAIESLMTFDMSQWDEPIPAREVGDSAYFSASMMWEFLGRHTFYHLGQLSCLVPRLSESSTLLYPNLTLE